MWLPALHPANQHTQKVPSFCCLMSLQAAVNTIVDGLFSALVTLGTVPIIKCPKVSNLHVVHLEMLAFHIVISLLRLYRCFGQQSACTFNTAVCSSSTLLLLFVALLCCPLGLVPSSPATRLNIPNMHVLHMLQLSIFMHGVLYIWVTETLCAGWSSTACCSYAGCPPERAPQVTQQPVQ